MISFPSLKVGALGASLLFSAAAFSQARSSFLDISSVSGITVTPSNAGLTYLVSVGANPTFTYNSTTYTITDLIGFYALSNDDDLVVTNADSGVWSTNNSNSGPGGVAGWKTNPNSGLTPGQSYTFTYSALSLERIEEIGFDVRLNGTFPGTNGNTGRIALVPEPASLTILAVGLIAIIKRKRS